MSIDERRVTAALRTYARDIQLTEADLDRLETRLTERAHPTARRGRGRPHWEWAVAACAVVALVLAVTALWRTDVDETLPAAPPSITPADLAGVWMVDRSDSAGHLWHFSADGRRGTTNEPAEYLALESDLTPYVIERGNVLHLLENECRATVRLTPEGTMTLTPLEDQPDCEVYSSALDVWRLIRVSPVSVAGAMLVEHPHAGPALPVSDPESMTDMAGTWLLQGTGTLLVVESTSPAGGRYVVDDDGDGPMTADERGRATLRPDGSLVLQPIDGAQQGCNTVFERVRTTGKTVETKLAESSCGRLGGATGTWVRLS